MKLIGNPIILIKANQEIGDLYGAFKFLRILQISTNLKI